MARRKHTDPRVKWHVYIPGSLAGEIELILLDPLLGQPKHGAKSELVTELLQRWLAEHKAARSRQQQLSLEQKRD